MPRSYKRTTNRQTWTKSQLATARHEVDYGMSVRATAAKYGIPRTTLIRRMAAPSMSMNMGPKDTVFTEAQENELVQHLLDLESRFYGITQKDVQKLAFELAERNFLPHPFNKSKKMAGRDWVLGFLKRNSTISFRKPEATSAARARGFNKPAVYTFYGLLEKCLEDGGFDPAQIFNADETGISTVIVICFLSIIPWPGPSVFKISCSRDSSRVVRKIVQSKWLPILEKYQVKLPLECPFHPLRDIFGPQQVAKKQNRPSQWTCGLCGKSFFEEKHLDMHFENRHKSNINMAEDAVCLADYCDMMRCEVLIAKDATLSFGGDPNMMSTDIEVWNEATAYRTALSTAGPRDLAKVPVRKSFLPKILQTIKNDILSERKPPMSALSAKGLSNCDASEKRKSRTREHSGSDDDHGVEIDDEDDDEDEDDEDDDDESDNDSNATAQCEQNLVDSSLPPVDRKQQKLSEMQRMKANCKTEELDQLKTRCEILVRDCIVGLLVQLSLEDFKSMEEEMNRAVCWYLTCERYWEDGPLDQRPFPWGLVFVLVMVLSLGVCLCYYIIWILFDEDHSPMASNQITAHPSPTHGRHYLQPQSASIYHLQDGGHSATSLNSLGQISNQAVSSGTDLQHTPQIHATQVPYGDEGGYGYAAGSGGTTAVTDGAANAGTTMAGGAEFGELGQSEHYIYVTYPPELKRRLLERYGSDIYMQLLRKNAYEYY